MRGPFRSGSSGRHDTVGSRRAAPARSTPAARRGRARPSRRRRARRSSAAPSTRPRKRSAAARSASSGSTLSLRATLTAANSTSPTSWKRSSRVAAASSSSSSPRDAVVGHVVEVEPRRGRPPLRLAARTAARAGSPARRRRCPARGPSSVFLIWSQLRSTCARAVDLDLAEDVRVPAHELGVHVLGHLGERPGPRSSSSSDRKCTWKSTSPSSSSSLASSPDVRPRRRARRPRRPCAGRSSARPARGPTGTRAAAGSARQTRDRAQVQTRRLRAPPSQRSVRLRRLGRRRGRGVAACRRWRCRPAPVGRRLGRLGAPAARVGRRRRRGLRAVLAVGRLVALGALGLVLPALREVLHERVQRLLLVLGLERLLDRRPWPRRASAGWPA